MFRALYKSYTQHLRNSNNLIVNVPPTTFRTSPLILAGAAFLLLNVWYVYVVRHKIPFAAAMLDVSLRSMSKFKSAWLLPIWGMVLMGGLAFLWSVCAMSIVWAVDNGGNDSAQSVRGLIFFVSTGAQTQSKNERRSQWRKRAGFQAERRKPR
jgi:hypothetical protein